MNVKEHIEAIVGKDKAADIITWCWKVSYDCAITHMGFSCKCAKEYADDMLLNTTSDRIKIEGYNPNEHRKRLAEDIIKDYFINIKEK